MSTATIAKSGLKIISSVDETIMSKTRLSDGIFEAFIAYWLTVDDYADGLLSADDHTH